MLLLQSEEERTGVDFRRGIAVNKKVRMKMKLHMTSIMIRMKMKLKTLSSVVYGI